jgi:glycosyltransferase involved in cell wall biosynthesis
MAPESPIRVAPMPADTTAFVAMPTERIPGRFLFVGRLNEQKGLRGLLEALAWCPPDVTLDVVGEGEDGEALRAHAQSLELMHRVNWLGQMARAPLAQLYRRSQAVVMPSVQEGLGLVAVEAQLSRTPVIAYRSGGLPDVVDPQWGGLLVPALDTRALADAMTRVHRDAASVDAWGAAARAVMLQRFAPEIVAAGYQALYDEAMATRD